MRKKTITIIIFFIIVSCKSNMIEINYLEELGYTKNDKLLIVHADDLGMFPGQTDGTVDSIKNGFVTSTSIMATCPDFDRAIEILKENPEIDGGIHLTLNNEWQENYSWSPVLPVSKVPSLYNEKGFMWANQNDFFDNSNLDEALMEIEAQIVKVLDADYNPSHMDFHMGTVYYSQKLINGIVDLSKKYNIPIITNPWMYSAFKRIKSENFLIFSDVICIYQIDGESGDSTEIRKEAYKNALRALQPGINVFLIHPAYTEGMEDRIEMPYIRSNDLKVWMDPELKEYAEELGIKFIDYKKIKELQLKRWN